MSANKEMWYFARWYGFEVASVASIASTEKTITLGNGRRMSKEGSRYQSRLCATQQEAINELIANAEQKVDAAQAALDAARARAGRLREKYGY